MEESNTGKTTKPEVKIQTPKTTSSSKTEWTGFCKKCGILVKAQPANSNKFCIKCNS